MSDYKYYVGGIIGGVISSLFNLNWIAIILIWTPIFLIFPIIMEVAKFEE